MNLLPNGIIYATEMTKIGSSQYTNETGDLNPILVLKAVKDVKKCDFFYYIIGKSVIRAFQWYAQHPISHYGH